MKEALRKLSYGLHIITSHRNGKINGQTANSAFRSPQNRPRWLSA